MNSPLKFLVFFFLGLLFFSTAFSGHPVKDSSFTVSIAPLKTLPINTCAFGYAAHLVLGIPQSPSSLHFDVSVKGAAPGNLYFSWKGSFIEALSNAYIQNPDFNPLHANNPHPSCVTYTYTLTVMDAQKNTATATVTVNVVSVNVEGCTSGKAQVCHKGGNGVQKDVCTDANAIPPHISDKNASALGGHSGCCVGSCGNKCVSPMKSAAASLMEEDSESGLVLENFPDPFRTSTTVRFIVPEEYPVKLNIYDLSGKLIKTIFNEITQPEREYKVLFESADLSQGIYIYKLITPPETFQGKMILMAK